jgi:hypothetical protein
LNNNVAKSVLSENACRFIRESWNATSVLRSASGTTKLSTMPTWKMLVSSVMSLARRTMSR